LDAAEAAPTALDPATHAHYLTSATECGLRIKGMLQIKKEKVDAEVAEAKAALVEEKEVAYAEAKAATVLATTVAKEVESAAKEKADREHDRKLKTMEKNASKKRKALIQEVAQIVKAHAKDNSEPLEDYEAERYINEVITDNFSVAPFERNGDETA